MANNGLPLPFDCGCYDIGDERLASHREVMIRSVGGPTPSLGDPFTIVRGRAVHDVVVLAIDAVGLGWSARCGIVGPA